MSCLRNIDDVDLYAILDVQISATEAEIKKAYRSGGLPDNPLNLRWVNERPVLTTKRYYGGPSLVSDRDYESLVLTKMRQVAERQRLIDEMIKEELET